MTSHPVARRRGGAPSLGRRRASPGALSPLTGRAPVGRGRQSAYRYRMSDLVYPPVIATVKLIFRLLDLRVHVEGGEHIPRTGGAVLACNHVGYLDFTFAGFGAQPAGRLVRFMAKQEVFAHRIGGPLMRGMHHIPVDRSAGIASYKAALDALKDGQLVGVFPEATISQSFTVKEMKAGAARMAAATGVPLVPMAIWVKGATSGRRMLPHGLSSVEPCAALNSHAERPALTVPRRPGRVLTHQRLCSSEERLAGNRSGCTGGTHGSDRQARRHARRAPQRAVLLRSRSAQAPERRG